MRLLLAAALIACSQAANDGVAITPPMGWRDWNEDQCSINQQIMMATMDAVADASRGVSLAGLGYTDVGLDDCWQACGKYGPNNYTYHDENGAPVVDLTKFPDLKGMVDHAHSLNLTAGFYSNNCHCSDHCTDITCFTQDVKAVLGWGFDSIKLDGCGKEENVELWYNLLNWTQTNAGKKMVLVENCHNGPHTGSPASVSPFGPHVPTADWCPFHMYRSSTDIRPVFGSILNNLDTIPPLAAANLSRPGCWAYPDMLEVGITNTQSTEPPLSFAEARTHFGAWAIVSSPLVIGMNLSDAATVDAFWPIVSNAEAIAVNQQYAGFSGSRFYASEELTFFSPCGWWLPNCTYPSVMHWWKPLPGGDTAVLLMNNGDAPALLTLEWDAVPGLLSPQGTSVAVRDIWAHQDLGVMAGAFVPAAPTASRDSIFLRLTPKTS